MASTVEWLVTGQVVPMNPAAVAGIHAPIGNHTFRATGITAYLGNAGALEHARSMAAYDQALRPDKERLTLDEVERIRL